MQMRSDRSDKPCLSKIIYSLHFYLMMCSGTICWTSGQKLCDRQGFQDEDSDVVLHESIAVATYGGFGVVSSVQAAHCAV